MASKSEVKASNGASDRPQACDLIMRNGYILTVDAARQVFGAAPSRQPGNTILAVGPDSEIAAGYQASHVIDVHGAPVHPGLIDAHYHPTLHTTRGAVHDDPKAFANLGNQPGPYSRSINAMTDEDEYAALLADLRGDGCKERRHYVHGCGHDAGTDISAETATEIGIRASVTEPFLWDHTGGLPFSMEVERAPASRDRAMKLLGSQLWRNKDPNALIRGHVTIYGQATVSDELALAAKECADAADVSLSAHHLSIPAMPNMTTSASASIR